MVKSMTGFGSAVTAGKLGSIRVEARSYNHRFLDIRVRVHKVYQPLEPLIYQWTREHLNRGRVEISVQLSESWRTGETYVLNENALRFYLEAEKRVREEFGLAGRLDVPTLFGLRDLFVTTDELCDPSEDWPAIEEGLGAALQKMEAMQRKEGAAICDDLLNRISFLAGRLAEVRAASEGLPEQARERIRTRLTDLFGAEAVDQQRLAQEIVYACDKMDVTEEMVRLESHLSACEKGLREGSITGKRLDFLAQEILRELNTVNAKAGHLNIVYAIVDMKTEVEKIRENAQNLQ
jgi:uncharacterized protein (TIGR00255 family)